MEPNHPLGVTIVIKLWKARFVLFGICNGCTVTYFVLTKTPQAVVLTKMLFETLFVKFQPISVLDINHFPPEPFLMGGRGN